ncbi:DUF4410 domain-containing protein [Paraburkholderia rhizosphaerae]|nr:DUF4410 domain-containing protein [Paraburkholderia rhizosphaerae]
MFSLAGCGGGNVDRAEQASRAALVRPQAVFVYAFEIDPALVQTDHSLVETLNASLHGQSDSMRQLSLASGVQDALADEIVKELRGKGVPAIRLTDAPPLGQNVLIVRGTFEKVDAGNRASRLVIGLGAGKSQIATSVQLWYQAADGEQMLMESSKASRNSGHMPGMAETLGVGAVAGRLVESAAAGGVFHATSETLRASPIDDAKRVADLIAKRIVKLDSAEGWQTAPRTN